MAKDRDQKFEIFEFPTMETNGEIKMKNINMYDFFNDLTLEDPNTFLFEFELVCKTYDYAFDD